MNLYVILSDTFIGANVRYRSNQSLLELPDTAIFFQLNVINGRSLLTLFHLHLSENAYKLGGYFTALSIEKKQRAATIY